MPFWNPGMKTERSGSDPDAEIRLRSRGRIALDELLRDVRQAFRLMRRNPGFTAIVTLTLAVAIGANTALFSVVDGVLLQALPYREAQRLVQVHATHPQTAEAPLTPAEFYEYREQNRSFENMALLSFFEHEYYGPAGPEQLPGYDVSYGYFEMLGFAPLLGRNFTPEDEQSGGEERVIISHRFWQSRLAVTVLMAVILLAALIPARKGAKVDPASTLKSG